MSKPKLTKSCRAEEEEEEEERMPFFYTKKYRLSLRIAVSAICGRLAAWTRLIWRENQQEIMYDIWKLKHAQVTMQTMNQVYPHHPFPFRTHKHHRTSRWLVPTLRIYLRFEIQKLTGRGTTNEKLRTSIWHTIPNQHWSKARNKFNVKYGILPNACSLCSVIS